MPTLVVFQGTQTTGSSLWLQVRLSLASFMYVTDTEQHPTYDTPSYPGSGWMGSLTEYYAKQGQVRLCPWAPLHLPTPGAGNGQGSSNQAWVRWMPGLINVGMNDGHAQSVKLEELWNLSWHLDWNTPTIRP